MHSKPIGGLYAFDGVVLLRVSDVAIPERYFPENSVNFSKNRKNMYDSKIRISVLSSTANSR